MDNIASSIITPVVESLMAPLKKYLGFFFSSTKYVKKMKEKRDQLNLTEEDIRHKWEQAVARTHEVSQHVVRWLDEVEKVNEKAQKIPIDGIGCFNMAKRYKVGKRSSDILDEIQALETWRSKIEFGEAQIPLAVVASTSSTGPSTSAPYDTRHNFFESRKLVFDEAFKALQSNNESQKMIALSGMGGVGKTTMMEQLKKEVEASKLFDQVVKVILGESMSDIITLQRAIARYINVEDLSEETINARADRLCKMFEAMSRQGKKVLIIMDDLWKVFDLKDVGLSPPPNGFKLLFTSRYDTVCTQMGVRNNSIFRVGFLNGVEAKTLFFRVVEVSDGDDPALQKIGDAIVTRCGGLPIAIVTIARRLSGNIEEAWIKALWRLKEDDIEDLESVTHRIFEMSYESLKKDEDKAIFILSGIFPDDFDIRIEDLFRFGWGLCFFKDAKTLATARRDVKICVNNLIRANLLIESDVTGCVKMHDLLRAFVLSKVSKVKQASIMNYDKKAEQYENVSYDRILLSCDGMTRFPMDFNHPNLSMLMLMNGFGLLKFPEDTYERMEKLEVLSYEKMHIPMFPKHSTKLRTLCLRSCEFIKDDISLLGNLSNLETLSFIDCKIERLPSPIGKLKKLRLLEFNDCVHFRVDDGVFQNLSNLEELYMRASKDSVFRLTKANCDELEKISQGLFGLELEFVEYKAKPKNMSFKNLERFRISIGCGLVETNSFKNTIHLFGDCNELVECKINDLFDKTEELYLRVKEMYCLEDILTHHSFSKLTVLHVSKCADLTCLFTVNLASGLKMLERLTISQCHAMRTLFDDNSGVDEIRLEKLTFMSLTNLPKLVSLYENKIDFPELVELILADLPNFTSIYPDTSEKLSLFNKKVVIHRLEELYISKMKKLKQIWPSQVSTAEKSNVSMLKKIQLSKCKNLTNLFPSNPLPLLNHLEELEIEKCRSVEVLFNMEFGNICGNSKLRSIEVENLGKLKELWRMKGVNKCDIHIKCFKGVENIKIRNCSMFKDLFTPVTANFDLEALTNYRTWYTGEKIDDDGNMEITEVDDSNKLTYPCYPLRTSHHLQRLELYYDKRVGEVVFDQMDTTPCTYLEELHLVALNEMSHVWECTNWNPQHHQPQLHHQLPFQNLTIIYLRNCQKIKYLFSPLMAKYLSNLKRVDIWHCDGIEEVVSSIDDENEKEENTTSTTTTTSSHENILTTFFPHLDCLMLDNLPRIKRIDDGGDDTMSRRDKIHDETQSGQVIGACWSLCQYPKRIDITSCDALGSLIPWYASGQMKRLQVLYIDCCKTMTEIFESDQSSSNINVDEESANDGVGATLLTSPTLKIIPTLVVVPQLSNLKVVIIKKCDSLAHVFTLSTLESLKQLKQLIVIACKAIQVIVKEENGTTSTAKDVHVFPRLMTIKLEDLPNLKGFFLGVNDFKWPSLEHVTIKDCPQLMMFTSGHSKTPKLKYIHSGVGKHSVESFGLNFHGTIINEYYQTTFPDASSYSDHTISEGVLPCSFHNLIKIYDNRCTDGAQTNVIPSHALLQLQKLQKIHLKGSFKVKEVFEVVALEGRNNNISGFNESQATLVQIPNLTKVKLQRMHHLKYLWKSTQRMVLEFPNLTTVDIQFCLTLKHVFTCSMVGSLVQLQVLSIKSCDNIKVIVKEEEKKECDGKVNEIIIMLPRLKSLKLNKLPSLKGFCLGNEAFSLPSLDTLEIKDCQAITGFTKGHLSTPALKVIDTSFGKYYVNPDLNSFIKTKQEEEYEF